MWNNINISIIHHINHGIIPPYCFIRPAMYGRCELVSTIHILTYRKASFQWATFRHLRSDKHVKHSPEVCLVSPAWLKRMLLSSSMLNPTCRSRGLFLRSPQVKHLGSIRKWEEGGALPPANPRHLCAPSLCMLVSRWTLLSSGPNTPAASWNTFQILKLLNFMFALYIFFW